MAHVLVLDDEATVRTALIRMLQRDGHDAIGAATGEDAMAHASSHPVDVLVTDLFMPAQDGFEVLRQFRRRFPLIRTIAMSGGGVLGMDEVLDIAGGLGIATLRKPISSEQLNAAVDEPGRIKTFLPVELATPDDVAALHARVMAAPTLVETLNALPGYVLLLNQQRQTVFANQAALMWLGVPALGKALGLRPGSLWQCAHAGDSACGTTEFCRFCGAGRALAGALRDNANEQECRITSARAGDELDLRIAARPFAVGDDQMIMVVVTDIANEKRREVLEAIFFHDVLNTAGGIHGLTQIIPSSSLDKLPQMHQTLAQLSETLVDEIKMQRDLVMAERGDLEVTPTALDAQLLLDTVASHYRTHPVAAGRHIVVKPAATHIAVDADPTLLGRVLGNMVKNALEAVPVGDTVRLSVIGVDDGVRFTIQNPSVMPDSAQKQVFQRSFSTKGPARGLGTYSMRLLTERYLKGRVWFESDAEHGTRFHAEIPSRRHEAAA